MRMPALAFHFLVPTLFANAGLSVALKLSTGLAYIAARNRRYLLHAIAILLDLQADVPRRRGGLVHTLARRQILAASSTSLESEYAAQYCSSCSTGASRTHSTTMWTLTSLRCRSSWVGNCMGPMCSFLQSRRDFWCT